MNLKEFGIYFANLRERSGFKSQRELADISGVSHSTINRIEAGTHKVSPDNLKLLAPHLKGVDYYDLMKAIGYIDENIQRTEDGMFFFGGPEKYSEDEIAEMEAALERYRQMKKRAAEQAKKDQKK
ncbi:MAG: helix-turn-helix transcriptional regulator [Paenibacillus sp.]|uniref:helix-turn-helix domain-containing protein n=1 Tax=Paenibacillus TaxID=44249 RepID=UPI0029151A45|nr:helix-turn-helix transcriptional regulator [Paenibacillus sp.]MDU4696419.1 helix-turn-helix transcriptional regulator [Paenibacillus sp.]